MPKAKANTYRVKVNLIVSIAFSVELQDIDHEIEQVHKRFLHVGEESRITKSHKKLYHARIEGDSLRFMLVRQASS